MKNRQKKFFYEMPIKTPFIHEGDKVVLNVRRITSRPDFDRMQESYKKFVNENEGVIFTAHCVRPHTDGFSVLIEVNEDQKWLFVQDDLVKYNG